MGFKKFNPLVMNEDKTFSLYQMYEYKGENIFMKRDAYVLGGDIRLPLNMSIDHIFRYKNLVYVFGENMAKYYLCYIDLDTNEIVDLGVTPLPEVDWWGAFIVEAQSKIYFYEKWSLNYYDILTNTWKRRLYHDSKSHNADLLEFSGHFEIMDKTAYLEYTGKIYKYSYNLDYLGERTASNLNQNANYGNLFPDTGYLYGLYEEMLPGGVKDGLCKCDYDYNIIAIIEEPYSIGSMRTFLSYSKTIKYACDDKYYIKIDPDPSNNHNVYKIDLEQNIITALPVIVDAALYEKNKDDYIDIVSNYHLYKNGIYMFGRYRDTAGQYYAGLFRYDLTSNILSLVIENIYTKPQYPSSKPYRIPTALYGNCIYAIGGGFYIEGGGGNEYIVPVDTVKIIPLE